MNKVTEAQIAAKAYELYLARFNTDEGRIDEDFLSSQQLYELQIKDWFNAKQMLEDKMD